MAGLLQQSERGALGMTGSEDRHLAKYLVENLICKNSERRFNFIHANATSVEDDAIGP
jgi:hypothetical protein